MVRLLMIGFLSVFLVACSETAEDKNTLEEATEVAVEAKTDEQYVEGFKSAINYETLIAGTENSSVTPVDVDGDSIPEMVLIVNEQVNSAYIATYKWTNNQWTKVTKDIYTSPMYVQLSFEEMLHYEQTSKSAFVIGVEEAAAGDVFKDLDVFMFDDVSGQVNKKVSFQLDTQYNNVVVVKDNKFNFKNLDGIQIDYTFQDGQFIDHAGNRLGTLIEDDLADLIGTTINNYYLSLTDTYESAIAKISETADITADDFYDACAYYDTFSFCNTGEGMELSIIDLIPSKTVTASELEKYFGEPIIIIDSQNSPENLGYFFAEVMTESMMYGLEFDGTSTDAKLKKITLATYTQ